MEPTQLTISVFFVCRSVLPLGCLLFQHTEKWTLELTAEMDKWLGVLVRHQADKVCFAFRSKTCEEHAQSRCDVVEAGGRR